MRYICKKNEYLKVLYCNDGEKDKLTVVERIGLGHFESDEELEVMRDWLESEVGLGEHECIVHVEYEYVSENNPFGIIIGDWDGNCMSLIETKSLKQAVQVK